MPPGGLNAKCEMLWEGGGVTHAQIDETSNMGTNVRSINIIVPKFLRFWIIQFKMGENALNGRKHFEGRFRAFRMFKRNALERKIGGSFIDIPENNFGLFFLFRALKG